MKTQFSELNGDKVTGKLASVSIHGYA